MAENPRENVPIVLFCFDFLKQTELIVVPVEHAQCAPVT